MTQGKSEEEAIRNIKEAIHLVLQATRGGESREPKLTVTAVALEA
jgi:predicted RNase H-like HicB family nuclease